MKKYSIHIIYPIIIGVFLVVVSINSINEFLDPTYHVISRRYIPRALLWYFAIYCWYEYFTTAYVVEIDCEGMLTLKSILATTKIHIADIISITKGLMFVTIIHKSGKVSVSTLIDGVANISDVLGVKQSQGLNDKALQVPCWRKVIKVIFIVILAAYAVHIELEQFRLYAK